MSAKLAVLGGDAVVPEGAIKPWPPIDDTDRKLVLESLNSDKHTFGPQCRAFQDEFAAWNGNKFAITSNSGTAALHMGVSACGCGVGDEVIVTAYSWSSSATCILHHDAIPVFVDIDFDTMNIDVDKIEAAITPKTKAIVTVHLHGLPVAMTQVMDIAERHGLKVIEDACQAHGARHNGKKVGKWGHCAAFSCNQNKCLCSGEGGLFVTDDEEILENAKKVWSFGESRTPMEDRDYHAYALGWMYRNNELTAAFGRAQLAKLTGYLEQQKVNKARLEQGLKDVPHLILPTEPEGCEHNWYNYVVRFDMEALGHAKDARPFRDKIQKALEAEGVKTAVWQRYALPAMTVFQAKNGYGHGHPWSHPKAQPVDYSLDQYPMAAKHCDRHVCIVNPLRSPNGPDVAEMVAEAFRKVMTNTDQVEQVDLS